MRETLQFVRLVDQVSKAIDALPNRIAAEAVKFSKERFVQQNWIGDRTEPWAKRKPGWGKKNKNQGRAIGVLTGRLKRGVRKISATPQQIVIGNDVEYAEVFNNGGRYSVSQQVDSFSRKAYTRKRAGRRETVSASTVKSFTRTVKRNQVARPFLAPSATLNKRLERLIASDIVKAVKTATNP
ncbi:hypothetical protein [Pelobium manganitolerans]|uniref:hypothetical protein n=1 Tax=Pelobium manganitolerans TaxID=1842495 RepID=UPI003FA38074